MLPVRERLEHSRSIEPGVAYGPLGFGLGKKTATSARRAAMDEQVAGKPRLTHKAMGMLAEARGPPDRLGRDLGGSDGFRRD